MGKKRLQNTGVDYTLHFARVLREQNWNKSESKTTLKWMKNNKGIENVMHSKRILLSLFSLLLKSSELHKGMFRIHQGPVTRPRHPVRLYKGFTLLELNLDRTRSVKIWWRLKHSSIQSLFNGVVHRSLSTLCLRICEALCIHMCALTSSRPSVRWKQLDKVI
jgi:hypothetical protein